MQTPVGDNLRLEVAGVDAIGAPITFVALLPISEGETGEERLLNSGLEYIQDGEEVVIDNVTYGSPAAEAGFDWDQVIEVVRMPVPQPSKYWMYIPAFALLGFVVMLQRGRRSPEPATA